MKEKLYTIPVNDAFDTGGECPLCAMRQKLEKDSIEYTMGPSYMEDDIRMETDRIGFCNRHMEMLWDENNRLGLALVISTHMKKIIQDVSSLSSEKRGKAGLFKKEEDKLSSYLKTLEDGCFVCNRIENSYKRYLATIFHLWKADAQFKEKYIASRGFCNQHYMELLEGAEKQLTGGAKEEFRNVTTDIYLKNMKRVLEDVEWFINKFDYRYQDEPWKNAKDALPRAMTKLNGIIIEE